MQKLQQLIDKHGQHFVALEIHVSSASTIRVGLLSLARLEV